MGAHYKRIKSDLEATPRHWLITGVAGFIGSNLLETLLQLGQTVTGLDNFATGHHRNLDDVRAIVGRDRWQHFSFVDGDICDLATCRRVTNGSDHVLHQAALGSVPRSIADPIATNQSNVSGFLNMLVASRDADVKNFIYAASSSTYGDSTEIPKVEENIGTPLSPYAITKYVNELYASIFADAYGLESIGLRYFNVFGKRQDPNGAYAAVIPKWIDRLIQGKSVQIYGDGETSRDFCFIDNAVQANILAALAPKEAQNNVYNIGCNAQASLNELHKILSHEISEAGLSQVQLDPEYEDFRIGDVRHSRANIDKATRLLGYEPSHFFEGGIKETVLEFKEQLVGRTA